MPRFFVDNNAIEDNIIRIKGDDARHIALALRMAVGDRIIVCDYSQNEYDCILVCISPDNVECSIETKRCCAAEPPVRYVVYQCLPKGDKMDTIVQKSTECGVCRIVPFSSERCIVKYEGNSLSRKLERWNKIAHEASGQCGRGIVPEVTSPVRLRDIIAGGCDGSFLPLFCYEGDGTTLLPEVLGGIDVLPEEIRIIIGAEGGFSLDEAQALIGAGYIPVGLGRRILRCETAAPFVLACLCYEFEMKNGK